MASTDPYNHLAIRKQITHQLDHQWDLMDDINWQRGIDMSKYFLPLDKDNIVLPGASEEQRLVMTQMAGLMLNAFTSNLEDAIELVKQKSWVAVLNRFPVSPEFWDLGELFFEEEAKHSAAFKRYADCFLEETGIERQDLETLLPRVLGTKMRWLMQKNSDLGGFASWWLAAVTEEVSMYFYKMINTHKNLVDPLYHELHQKHFEEESRHCNYPYMMLNVLYDQPFQFRNKLFEKIDLLFCELIQTEWMITELTRVVKVKKFRREHPFFEVLHSCIPLFEKTAFRKNFERIFVSSPYLSYFINRNHRKRIDKTRIEHKAIGIPFPQGKIAMPDMS